MPNSNDDVSSSESESGKGTSRSCDSDVWRKKHRGERQTLVPSSKKGDEGQCVRHKQLSNAESNESQRLTSSSRKRKSNDRIENDKSSSSVHDGQRTSLPVVKSQEALTLDIAMKKITNLENLLLKYAEKQETQSSLASTSMSTMKADCIPLFDPGDDKTNTTRWLHKIDQLAEMDNWSERKTIHYMQTRLAGIARIWYDSLTTYEYSWNEWKSLILRTFPDVKDFATLLRTMLNRKKRREENWHSYYFDKIGLIKACGINDRNAVSCIIDGINDISVQTGAKAGRYDTPEELYSNYFTALSSMDNNQYYDEASFNKPVTERLGRRDELMRRQSVQRHHPYPKESPRKFNKLRCFNCNELGHLADKCSKPRKSCTICKRLGHVSTECRRKNSASVLLAKSLQASCSRYKITCKVNGQEVPECLVDTGCSGVLIQRGIAQKLGLTWTPCDVTIRGYNNSYTKTIGKVKVTLQVDEAQNEVDALVVEDCVQNFSMLIGESFLKQNLLISYKDDVCVIEDSDLARTMMDIISSRKVNLRTSHETVIPPGEMKLIDVTSSEADGDVFVEFQVRPKPNNTHFLVQCVTAAPSGIISILNTSPNPVKYEKNQVIARGMTCYTDCGQSDLTAFSAFEVELTKFTRDDIARQISDSLNEVEVERLLNLINEYRECFATTTAELGKYEGTEMNIQLTDERPITYRPYRLSYDERMKVRSIVENLESNGIIRESQSPYASPILLVKKKTNDWRMCVDYRALNAKTVKDRYPLPRVDEHLDRLAGCKYFTSLDLAAGYHQIPMSKSSIEKTAFITPDGHYEYLRMPFGLVNAPAVFQRTINHVLGPLRFTQALAYMDDILLPSSDIETGFESLRNVLNVFRDARLTLNMTKCHFFQSKVDYLGHEISECGIRPGTRKVEAVEKFPTPLSVHNVRQFVGLCSYFRKYIKGFSFIARPLTLLTCKGEAFVWGTEQQRAFKELKEKLVSRPVLSLYRPGAPTELHTDASKWGIAGILMQQHKDGSLHPILYYSRQTSKEEQRYHSYELEAMAVVYSMKHFRPYLLGFKFKVVTDCNALRTTMTKRDLIPRIGRWWLAISEFDFEVEYRPGTKMGHADALSRNPVTETDDWSEVIDVNIVDITMDDWILTTQLVDKRCRYLTEVLQNTSKSNEEKQIHQEFKLIDNRIFKQTSSGIRWLVPKHARRQVVAYYHDDVGHFGLEKVLKAMEESFWFSGMRRYAKRYIQCCLRCLYNKNPTGKQPGLLQPIEKIALPMDTLHVDHLGPFVKSKRHNQYLIVAVDSFTKFIFLRAVKSTKVDPLTKFLDDVFGNFGVTRRLICDKGAAFTSKKFREYCAKYNIKLIHNATATPRANGQVERYNRTLLHAIASSTDDEERWDECLEQIRFGMNSTINAGTKKSPYEVLMGYKPKPKSSAYLLNEINTQVVQDNLTKIRKDVEATIVKDQERQKERYDRKRRPAPTYEVGQLVLIKRSIPSNDGKSRKLLQKNAGPYLITKLLPHDRYCIEDIPGSKRSKKPYKGIVAVDKIKLYSTNISDDDIESDEEGDVLSKGQSDSKIKL